MNTQKQFPQIDETEGINSGLRSAFKSSINDEKLKNKNGTAKIENLPKSCKKCKDKGFYISTFRRREKPCKQCNIFLKVKETHNYIGSQAEKYIKLEDN